MSKLVKYKSFEELKSVPQNLNNKQSVKLQSKEIEMFYTQLNEQLRVTRRYKNEQKKSSSPKQ